MSTQPQSNGGNSDAHAAAQAAQEGLQRILTRSATDMEFRRKLIDSPRAAVAEFTGRDESEIPASFAVRFIENKGDATIVLPDVVDPASELSDQELEAVAGGLIWTPLVSASLAVSASAIWATKEIKKLGDDDAWFS